jgi:TolA-binding protein
MSASNPLAATLLTLLIAVAPAASAEVQPRVFVPRQASVEPPWLQSQLRDIDDHYAARTQEMQQQLHQALETMKQQPTAEQLNALRDAIGRLESQVKQLSAATTRTEGDLTGLKTQLDTLQSAAKPAPAAVNTADAEFEQAMTALRAGKDDIDPMRRWTEQHRTDPKAPEGYLQMGMQMLTHNPVLAQQYLKRVVNDYPASPQATQAKYMLASTIPVKAAPAKPKVVRRKTTHPATPPVPTAPSDSDEPVAAARVQAPSKPNLASGPVQAPSKPGPTQPEKTTNKDADEDIPTIHIKPSLSIPKDKRAGS